MRRPAAAADGVGRPRRSGRPGSGRDPRACRRWTRRDLDAATRAEVVSAWEAQDSWLEAQKLSALHAMSLPGAGGERRRPDGSGVRRWSRSGSGPRRPGWRWGAPRGGRSSGPGSPTTLATRLPVTRELLAAGRISAYLAGIAVAESQRLTDAECVVFEARVYPRGESQTPARFRKSARLVAAVLHPRATWRTRTPVAKQATDVTKWVDAAGMASLRMHAPAPVIFEVWDAVNTEAWAQARAAKKAGEEQVPIGERRVAGPAPLGPHHGTDLPDHQRGLGINPDDPDPDDVTALIAEQVSDGTDLEQVSEPGHRGAAGAPRAGRRGRGSGARDRRRAASRRRSNPLGLPTGPAPKVQVGVIIDLDVLLGARDGPAILEGYGTIPASMARQLAADGSWRRVLLEPVEGWLLDYGRDTLPTIREAPRPPARSRAGLPRAVLQRPTQADRPRHRLGRRRWHERAQPERAVHPHPLPQDRAQLHASPTTPTGRSPGPPQPGTPTPNPPTTSASPTTARNPRRRNRNRPATRARRVG